MTLSYILNFDQLFAQRNLEICPMHAVNDPYHARLTMAYEEFSDRTAKLKQDNCQDSLAMDHLSLLCYILKNQIDSEQLL